MSVRKRLFGAADIDHSHVRPHNRHQHLLPDMREKIVPEIVVVSPMCSLLIGPDNHQRREGRMAPAPEQRGGRNG